VCRAWVQAELPWSQELCSLEENVNGRRAGHCHSGSRDAQVHANRAGDRWGHKMEEVGIGKTGFCFQDARCQLQLSICLSSASSLVVHCLHGMNPNTCADLTEGGWLGEKARDLHTQIAQKHKVPVLDTYPGSQNPQVTVQRLKRPQKNLGCYSKSHICYHRTCHHLSCHPLC
jgi:hypothetical protein